MSTITTRAGKGSPLTNNEVDANFTNLNTDKAELSGAAFTGAITTNSTIDGRDVATDGTKLDGIESGATADQTAAQIKTAYESNSDTNAFTDADESKLDGIEASADVTDAINVEAAGALMDSELTSIASVKALNQGVATGDSPTFAALTSTGEITANGGIALGDSDKATFGASDDLQIYHDGSNSYIDDAGSGYLLIRGSAQTRLSNADSSENYFIGVDGAQVELAHAGSKKLATTSTGIDVTGEVVADGLTLDGGVYKINNTAVGSGSDKWIGSDGGAGIFVNAGASGNFNVYNNNAVARLGINGSTGDISFYEDTGTTPKFFWDASAESLGIGTSSPEVTAHVSNAVAAGSDNLALRIQNPTNAADARVGIGFHVNAVTGAGWDGAYIQSANTGSDSGDLRFGSVTNNTLTERMRIDSSGNLLVGTTQSNPTSSSVNVAGQEFSTTGGVRSTVASNAAATFNRKTDDGEIVLFRKDGTTVGSIGTETSNSDLYIGNGDTAIMFHDGADAIFPHNASTNAGRDAAIDIGYSTYRFKDLYLSGGVYLGGTGSANKLDDYEEGSWTPDVSGSSSTSGVGYAVRQGFYTKVGNMVTANFSITFNDKGSMSGTTRITGLPFSGANSPQQQHASMATANMNVDKDQTVVAIQYAVNALAYLYVQESGLALSQISGNSQYTDTSQFIGSLTYFTNS